MPFPGFCTEAVETAVADDSVRKFFLGFAVAIGVGAVPLAAVIASRPAAPQPEIAQAFAPAKPAPAAPKAEPQPAPTPQPSRPRPAEPEAPPTPPQPLDLAPPPLARPEPAPPPKQPEPPLTELPAGYRLPAAVVLGPEIHVGKLRVQPLRGGSPPVTSNVVSLRQAMAEGKCRVSEHPRDGFVRVHNEGDRPVLCVAGELLLGGRKDRVICAGEVIPPRTVDYNLPVQPVEGERKTEDPGAKAGEFRMDDKLPMVDLRTRALAAGGARATSVLARVAAFNRRLGAAESASIRAGIAAADTRDHMALLRAAAHPETVGFVVRDADGIVAVDWFCSRELFARYAPALMASYALAADETAAGAGRVTACEAGAETERCHVSYTR